MVHYRRCGLQPRGLVPTSRLLPPRAPRLWTLRAGGNPEGSWQQQDMGVAAPASPALPGLESRSFWSPPVGPLRHSSFQRGLLFTDSAWSGYLSTMGHQKNLGQLADNQVLIFPLRATPLPGTKGIFSFWGPRLHWSSCIFSQGGGGLSKDAEWQGEECHLNIPPPSRERFGWGLKDAGLWQGQAWLPFTVSRSRVPVGNSGALLQRLSQSGLVLKLVSKWGEDGEVRVSVLFLRGHLADSALWKNRTVEAA